MNACRRHLERLSDHLDGTLPPAEAERLREHLDQCPACRQALEELRLTLDRIRAVEPVEPPPWLAERILARVREQPAPRPRWLSRVARPSLPAAALVLLCLAGYLVMKGPAPQRAIVPQLPAAVQQDAATAEAPPRAAAKAGKRRPVPPPPAAALAPELPPAPSAAPPAYGAMAEQAGQDQARAKASVMARKAQASRAGPLVFRLAVRDPRGAGPQVQAAFLRAGATILSPPSAGRTALTARVPSSSLPALFEQLDALGTLEGIRPPAADGEVVEVQVTW